MAHIKQWELDHFRNREEIEAGSLSGREFLAAEEDSKMAKGWYVKVFGERALAKAVLNRLHELGYRLASWDILESDTPVQEIGIGVGFASRALSWTDHVGWLGQQDVEELSLSDLFDGTFPKYKSIPNAPNRLMTADELERRMDGTGETALALSIEKWEGAAEEDQWGHVKEALTAQDGRIGLSAKTCGLCVFQKENRPSPSDSCVGCALSCASSGSTWHRILWAIRADTRIPFQAAVNEMLSTMRAAQKAGWPNKDVERVEVWTEDMKTKTSSAPGTLLVRLVNLDGGAVKIQGVDIHGYPIPGGSLMRLGAEGFCAPPGVTKDIRLPKHTGSKAVRVCQDGEDSK